MCAYKVKYGSLNSGIFLVFSGAEIRPHCQWNSGDFFPNFDKKSQSSNKNQKIFFLSFLKIAIFIQSTHIDATW